MKKQNLLGIMTMAMMMSDISNPINTNEISKPKKVIKKIIPKNHKEFFYDNKSVWALNKKNADKKAKKLGLII